MGLGVGEVVAGGKGLVLGPSQRGVEILGVL